MIVVLIQNIWHPLSHPIINKAYRDQSLRGQTIMIGGNLGLSLPIALEPVMVIGLALRLFLSPRLFPVSPFLMSFRQ